MTTFKGDARHLPKRVDTGIRTPRPVNRDRPALEQRQHRLQGALHRLTFSLPLPADEAGAVVGEGQLEGPHGWEGWGRWEGWERWGRWEGWEGLGRWGRWDGYGCDGIDGCMGC